MALPLLRREHDDDRARPAPPLPDAWRELEELRSRLDRVMDSIWQTSGAMPESGLGWSPAVDVEEADDAWWLLRKADGLDAFGAAGLRVAGADRGRERPRWSVRRLRARAGACGAW